MRSVLALAAALCLCVVPPVSATPTRCAPAKRARVVARTNAALVFRRGPLFYGCFGRSGRTRLLPNQDRGEPSVTVLAPQLAGHYVGFESLGSDEDLVAVFDLRSGHEPVEVSSTSAAGGNQVRPPQVKGLAVARDGSVAWIAGKSTRSAAGTAGPVTYEVRSTDPRHGGDSVLLDSGADIAPRSLALSGDGSSVFWLRGGAARSAALP